MCVRGVWIEMMSEWRMWARMRGRWGTSHDVYLQFLCLKREASVIDHGQLEWRLHQRVSNDQDMDDESHGQSAAICG